MDEQGGNGGASLRRLRPAVRDAARGVGRARRSVPLAVEVRL